jgi:hypothetical protein
VNQRLVTIETKRARLLERAARERADVAQTLQRWEQPLSFIDHCLQAVRYVIVRPPLLGGATLLLVLLRPRSAFRWARRAFALWQGYRWLTKKIAV